MARLVKFGSLNARMLLRNHPLVGRAHLVTSVAVLAVWVLGGGLVPLAAEVKSAVSQSVASEPVSGDEKNCCGGADSLRLEAMSAAECDHAVASNGSVGDAGSADSAMPNEASWWNGQRISGLLVCFLSTFVFAFVLVESLRRKAWRGIHGFSSDEPWAYDANAGKPNVGFWRQSSRGSSHRSQLLDALKAEAAANERQRIAMNLHDSVEQTLAAAAYHLQAATMAPSESMVQRYIGMAEDAVRLSRQEIRATINQLHGVWFKNKTLREVMEEACLPLVQGRDLKFQLNAPSEDFELDASVTEHLVFMAREAVSNAVRHAKAENVSLNIQFGQRLMLVEIVDDGIGFDQKTSS